MSCRTVPRRPCHRCGGRWWHHELHGQVWHSCVWCGYEPAAAHLDPRAWVGLKDENERDARAEGRALEFEIPGLGQEPLSLTGYDARSLARLSAERAAHFEGLRVRMATPEELAQLDGRRAPPPVTLAFGENVVRPAVATAPKGTKR